MSHTGGILGNYFDRVALAQKPVAELLELQDRGDDANRELVAAELDRRFLVHSPAHLDSHEIH